MKNLQIRNISDIVYFKALEWRARLMCKTWEELFEKIFRHDELLSEISKVEAESNKAGILWARMIDEKLDARDREIVEKKEDFL